MGISPVRVEQFSHSYLGDSHRDAAAWRRWLALVHTRQYNGPAVSWNRVCSVRRGLGIVQASNKHLSGDLVRLVRKLRFKLDC